MDIQRIIKTCSQKGESVTEIIYQLFLAYYKTLHQPVDIAQLKEELLEAARSFAQNNNSLISDFEKELKELDKMKDDSWTKL